MTKSKETEPSERTEKVGGKKLKQHTDSTLQSQLLWFRLPDSTQILKELSAVLHAYPSLSLFLTPMLYGAFTTTGQKEIIVSRNTVRWFSLPEQYPPLKGGGLMNEQPANKQDLLYKWNSSYKPFWSKTKATFLAKFSTKKRNSQERQIQFLVHHDKVTKNHYKWKKKI